MPPKQQMSPFLRAGVPMIALVLGGFVLLKSFVQGKHDIRDAQQKEVDLRAPVAKQRAKKFSLEGELQRLKEAGGDSKDYENKPVPRPNFD